MAQPRAELIYIHRLTILNTALPRVIVFLMDNKSGIAWTIHITFLQAACFWLWRLRVSSL